MGLGRNDGLCSPLGEPVAQARCIVGAVGQHLVTETRLAIPNTSVPPGMRHLQRKQAQLSTWFAGKPRSQLFFAKRWRRIAAPSHRGKGFDLSPCSCPLLQAPQRRDCPQRRSVCKNARSQKSVAPAHNTGNGSGPGGSGDLRARTVPRGFQVQRAASCNRMAA